MPIASLVIPAFNEEGSLERLAAEAIAALTQSFVDFEVLLIDDGSTDRTGELCERIALDDHRFRYIRLTRNFGKAAAYTVGFSLARGDFVITCDADLQDDLSELPKLLARLDMGYELVVGRKDGRLKNEPLKTIPSFFFNALVAILFGLRVKDSNSGFRLMTRAVAKSLRLRGGTYRFIPELAHLNGFRVSEIPVSHRRRVHGVSKFGPARFWTGILDLLSVRFVTAFTQRPFHFFGTLGIPLVTVGGGLECYALAMKFAGDTFQDHIAAIIGGAVLILAGLQITTTGLIGELLAAKHGYPDIGYSELRAGEFTAKQSTAFQIHIGQD